MDLKIQDQLFFVSGATSGFGKAIVGQLIDSGAKVIVNARNEERLQNFVSEHPDQLEFVAGDISSDAVISEVINLIADRQLHGAVVNAGGPPAGSFLQTPMTEWDKAYKSVLRWKVKITHAFLPLFRSFGYGKLVYIESASVKQPIENLVLSNSLRMAVVGFVKTLSEEVAHEGINLNILAPGYHATPAMERLFIAKSAMLGISPEQARAEFEAEIRSGKLGDPNDLGSLAAWLLSPLSSYLTGQTIAIDGGLVRSSM